MKLLLSRAGWVVAGLALLVGMVALVIKTASTAAAQPETNMNDLAVTAAGQVMSIQFTQAAWTPTPGNPGPSAADVAATMAAIPINAAATAEAEQRRQEAIQATADAREYNRQSTQIAQATATEQYWMGIYYASTATAAYAQTATSYPPTATAQAWTQTAIPLLATAEANRINAESTVVSGNAIRVDMAVRQQRWSSPLATLGMWFVIIVALALVAWVAYQSSQARKLTPDGTTQLLKGADGTLHVVNSSLMPTAVMSLAKNQPATAAGMIDRDFQADVTRRSQEVQAIEAAARGQRPQEALDAVAALMGPQTARYTTDLPAGDVINGQVKDSLDSDWEGDK